MNPVPLTEFFSAFAAASWRAAWLIVVLIALRRLVRGRVPAGVWFFAWLVVAVRLLVPVSVPMRWSPYNITSMPSALSLSTPPAVPVSGAASVRPAPEVAPEPTPSAPSSTSAPVAAAASAIVVPPPIRPARPSGLLLIWPDLLPFVWLLGVALLGGTRLAASRAFRRRLRTARPVDERVARVVRREARAWGLRGEVLALETAAVGAPALFGLWRPRLLLPPGFAERLSDEELRLVVRHELAHAHRRDLAAQALVQAAVVLHWFNPLAWLAARLARADCELACDEAVLRRESEAGKTAYGAALLKVLGLAQARPRPAGAVAIFESRQQLAERVRLIADYRASTALRVWGGVLLVAVLAAASLTRESQAQDREGKTPADARVDARGTAVQSQRAKVDELSRRLAAYQEQNRLISPDTRRDIANESLKSASREVERANLALRTAAARVQQIQELREKGGDLTSLPFVANQPLIVDLNRMLMEQRLALAKLDLRYRENHPTMIAAQASLKQTELERQRAIDAICTQCEQERDAAAKNLQARQQELAQRQEEALELERQTTEYRRIEQELAAQNQLLRSNAAPVSASPALGTSVPAADEFSVGVLGAVNQQGTVTFRAKDRPIVLDAIARSGGFTREAGRRQVQLSRAQADGQRAAFIVSEEALMTGAEPNGVLRRGDIVIVNVVADAKPAFATVTGAVNQPGRFALPIEQKHNLVELISLAGGPTRLAHLKTVKVTRIDSQTNQSRVLTVNVDAMIQSGAEPFMIEAGDIIFVPERII